MTRSQEKPMDRSALDWAYTLLGVSSTASQQEIRKAYLAKAKKHHPDHEGDSDVMKALNSAYEALKKSASPLAPERGEEEDDETGSKVYSPGQVHLETLPGGITLEFVWIPAGVFMMGGEKWEQEQPRHQVTFTQGFWLGAYQVTQAQWRAVMGSNPSKFTGSNLPVENVSWGDCRVFFEKLNANGYRTLRLPSEAEWEYACRAGGTLEYSFGYSYSVPGLSDYAWFKKNSGGKTHPVGGKKANAWGLYDMHGNVWEWCQDCYHDTYSGAPTDGRAWETAADCFRVFRGGSWLHNPENCRSAKRIGHTPDSRLNDLGFRLAASSIR